MIVPIWIFLTGKTFNGGAKSKQKGDATTSGISQGWDFGAVRESPGSPSIQPGAESEGGLTRLAKFFLNFLFTDWRRSKAFLLKLFPTGLLCGHGRQHWRGEGAKEKTTGNNHQGGVGGWTTGLIMSSLWIGHHDDDEVWGRGQLRYCKLICVSSDLFSWWQRYYKYILIG